MREIEGPAGPSYFIYLLRLLFFDVGRLSLRLIALVVCRKPGVSPGIFLFFRHISSLKIP